MDKTTEKIPTWSLGYIINGDMTGLTDEEIRMIDEWQGKWNVQVLRTRKATHSHTFHITPFRTSFRSGGLRDTLHE